MQENVKKRQNSWQEIEKEHYEKKKFETICPSNHIKVKQWYKKNKKQQRRMRR
jgi:hypothetical protein